MSLISFVFACPLRRFLENHQGQSSEDKEQDTVPPSPPDRQSIGFEKMMAAKTQDEGEIRERHYALSKGARKVSELLSRVERLEGMQERFFVLLQVRALVVALNTVQVRSWAYDSSLSGYPPLSSSTDGLVNEARASYVMSVKRLIPSREERLALMRSGAVTEMEPGELDGSIPEAVGRLLLLLEGAYFPPAPAGSRL